MSSPVRTETVVSSELSVREADDSLKRARAEAQAQDEPDEETASAAIKENVIHVNADQ